MIDPHKLVYIDVVREPVRVAAEILRAFDVARASWQRAADALGVSRRTLTRWIAELRTRKAWNRRNDFVIRKMVEKHEGVNRQAQVEYGKLGARASHRTRRRG